MLSRPNLEPEALSLPLLLSWIHHDNMLEGRLYRPDEIAQALREDDESLDPYLRPLMRTIRRYRNAIFFIWCAAHQGRAAVSLENLKVIHKMITPDPRDRGGMYRRTSPVHRDYFQSICPAEKVPYHLKKLFELIEEDCDSACDPLAFAAMIHHRLMHAYPFRRNPGTCARLFTNLVLLSRGYPPAIIPSHRRDAYYGALNHPDTDLLTGIFGEAVTTLLEQPGGHLGLVGSQS
jgi:Fic family protein